MDLTLTSYLHLSEMEFHIPQATLGFKVLHIMIKTYVQYTMYIDRDADMMLVPKDQVS